MVIRKSNAKKTIANSVNTSVVTVNKIIKSHFKLGKAKNIMFVTMC